MIGALGMFTPIILILILIGLTAIFAGPQIDWSKTIETAGNTDSSLPNIYVSVLNYFALCMMTSASMLFVLGGSIMGLGNAEKGGILGGFLTGLITILIALLLYSKVDLIVDANVPMQKLLRNIHPVLGFCMAITIFGMIFNTGFSVCYSLAKRIAGDNETRFRRIMLVIVGIAFVLSFIGFKTLVAVMYPILGCIGILLLVVLLTAWICERSNIHQEQKIRKVVLQQILQELKQ